MRPLLKTATLTVGALTALTAVLLAFQPPPHVGSLLAAPVTQHPASYQSPNITDGPAVPVKSLTAASGLSTNSHGAPHPPAQPMPATAPDLRPELQSAYWLAIQSAPSGCQLSFSLLAAIGMVESGSLEGLRIDGGNRVVPSLIGPALDGKDLPSVPDTDAGQIDEDPVWDRAVGPMQLIPGVWRAAAVDMDGDGTRDPQNIFDAAGAAMVYLCADNRDLSTTRGVKEAVRSYNHLPGYLQLVLGWQAAYERLEDQTLSLQEVLSMVAPFPMFSQVSFSQVRSPKVPDARSEPVHDSATTGAQTPAVTAVAPGPDTDPPVSTPSGSSPAPSSAPTPPQSVPEPTPVPTSAPPAVPAPDPKEPVRTPTPDPTPTANPSPAPDPTPTCAIPPAEALGVTPTATPTDGTTLCPTEVDPIDPVVPVPTP